MKRIIKNKKKGFTLVELIVVFAILAILVLILIPAITGYISKVNESALKASARSLHTKAVMFAAEADKFSKENLILVLEKDLEPGYEIVVEDENVIDGTEYSFTVLYKGNQVTVNQNGIVEE